MAMNGYAEHSHNNLGNPKTQALGLKARQLRSQAAATHTPAPPTDKLEVGRAAVAPESQEVRHAQGKHAYTRSKGNA